MRLAPEPFRDRFDHAFAQLGRLKGAAVKENRVRTRGVDVSLRIFERFIDGAASDYAGANEVFAGVSTRS